MSFSNPSSPAKWILYTGVFFRWLCVYLVFANESDEFEFTASILPDGYAEFTWAAMIGVGFALLLTFAEIIWIHLKKNTEADAVKRHDLNLLSVRYFLAFIFFSYGIGKLLGQQFTSTYTMMDQSLAEANGFWLTWRFFDYSYSYKFFIGLGQVAASILFLSRRTTTLAAIIFLPMISNIVYVNIAFDIGVKFFSFCYLIFTIYLLLCDFDRLNALFIRNSSFPANKILELPRYNFFSTSSFKIIKTIFIVAIIVWPASDYFRIPANKSKVFVGSFQVKDFTHPDNRNDSTKWDKLYLEKWANAGSIKKMNGKRISFKSCDFDETNHHIQISFRNSTRYKNIQASYIIEADSSISANGLWGSDSIRFSIKRYFY
jgi:uncharacterized membrane protein YphA (DoxX/SURF4 family)